jgi:hypothetical protein
MMPPLGQLWLSFNVILNNLTFARLNRAASWDMVVQASTPDLDGTVWDLRKSQLTKGIIYLSVTSLLQMVCLDVWAGDAQNMLTFNSCL